MDVHVTDFVTIGLLVLLEGLLSADNALVLAILVLGLPKHEQRKALRYGIVGAFAFRALATIFAAFMIQLSWVKLVGAALPPVSRIPRTSSRGRTPNPGGRRSRPAPGWA